MAKIGRYEQLLPFLVSHIPSYNETLAIFELKRAGSVLCAEAEIWHEHLTAQALTVDVANYTLTPNWEASIQRILDVEINTAAGVTAGTDGSSQQEDLYTFEPPDTLVLGDSIKPRETIASGLVVEVVLVPYLNTSEIADWVINMWSDGILAHAKWQLFSMLSQPWGNSGKALLAEKAWNKELNKAKQQDARGYKVGQGLEA